MTTIRRCALLTACALLLASWAGSAKAVLIQDITFSGGGLSGSGRIEFAEAEGSNVNQIASMSLTGTGDLGNFKLDERDIQQAAWSIDPNDSALTLTRLDIDMSTIAGTATCLILGAGGGKCTATSSAESKTIAAQGAAWLQAYSPGNDGGQIAQGTITRIITDAVLTTATATPTALTARVAPSAFTATPTRAVPEPASLAVFLLGLIGLGLVIRRQKTL